MTFEIISVHLGITDSSTDFGKVHHNYESKAPTRFFWLPMRTRNE